ncbi:MAG: SAM-dependent methyltransferase, partial [Kiritimatiellia bacterium]
ELLVGVDVDSVPVRLAVAELLVRARAVEQAQPRLESLVAEQVAPARDLLARLLRDEGLCVDALMVLAGPGLTAGQLNTRAGIHALLGQVDAQLADLRSAVALDPSDGAVQHNLAVLLFQSGQPDLALVAHRASLRGASDDRARCIAVAETLARVSTFEDLDELLLTVLAMAGVDHQQVERALRKVIEVDSTVADALGGCPVSAGLIAALDVPLVHGLLRQTRVLGPQWEAMLTAVRRQMALTSGLDGHPELATSIAIQAWHTQYAWWAEPDELAAIDAVGMGDVERWPRTAAYRVLPADAPQPSSPGALPLWRLMVEQPGQERKLQAQIEVVGLTSDAVSTAVRAQYEQHPYPRLVSVHRKPPIALWSSMRQLLPWFDDVPRPDGPLQVLIAGCGTGQQVLTAGSRYDNAQILAVDLSRASLGVAARLVESWQLTHVQLAQADILALGPIERRFHVIECGGVLHHMADPLAGWRVLADLLAPGGLMKIGLYSEHARADVVAARQLASERGWSDSDDGLRSARRELSSLNPEHPARAVVWSPDFPSLSGFRDLVMHVCEHRFTLERLRDSLDELGLEFLGFQHPDPRAGRRYRASWPDDDQQRDLARWAELELRHPETFRGMLQFWCRRG